jgi:hypothetical protein
MGASMVKDISPLPCIGLGESDSILYTNFEFCEGKNHKFEKHINLQSQTICVDKKISKKKSMYFRRWCK